MHFFLNLYNAGPTSKTLNRRCICYTFFLSLLRYTWDLQMYTTVYMVYRISVVLCFQFSLKGMARLHSVTYTSVETTGRMTGLQTCEKMQVTTYLKRSNRCCLPLHDKSLVFVVRNKLLLFVFKQFYAQVYENTCWNGTALLSLLTKQRCSISIGGLVFMWLYVPHNGIVEIN